MANWAAMLYEQRAYADVFQYFSGLSKLLKSKMPEKSALATFFAAQAKLKMGDRGEVVTMLWQLHETHAGTEAGFRAWLKLNLSIDESVDRIQPGPGRGLR